jgi:hypothetical protein
MDERSKQSSNDNKSGGQSSHPNQEKTQEAKKNFDP